MNCLGIASAIALMPALSGTAVFADAIYFRAANSAFNGSAVTVATFDDAVLTTGATGSTFTNPVGGGSNLDLRTQTSGVVQQGLFAVKDMFTLLPASTIAGDISITSAKLHLYENASFLGTAGSSVSAQRVTSDWLLDVAGSNEDDVSGRYRRNSTTTDWATGSGGFGATDYDAATASVVWNADANAFNTIDVTAFVQTMYTLNQNYGFRLSTNSSGVLHVRSSEQTANITPVLEIQYTYVPVPEPACVALLTIGAFFITGRRG